MPLNVIILARHKLGFYNYSLILYTWNTRKLLVPLRSNNLINLPIWEFLSIWFPMINLFISVFPLMVSWYMSSKDLVLIRSLIRRKKDTISETLCGVVCSDNARRPNNICNGINNKRLSKMFLFQQNFVLAHIIYLCVADGSHNW